MLLNSEWNWGCLSRWLLNVHCRWMSEGKKLLQKLPGWMSEIGFFSVPFSVFWAKWESNLDEVKGVLKPRHPGERGLLCFDLGAGNELVCAPKPSRSSFLGWSWCLCVYYSNWGGERGHSLLWCSGKGTKRNCRNSVHPSEPAFHSCFAFIGVWGGFTLIFWFYVNFLIHILKQPETGWFGSLENTAHSITQAVTF